MLSLDRRGFLGSSLLGLGASPIFAPRLLAQESAAPKGKESTKDAAQQGGPDTLFLSWQRDPTTTMTIQWLGPESTEEVAIQYAPLGKQEWKSGKTITKPYTNTDV